MDRRELLKMIAVVTGGAVIGGEFLFSGCTNPDAPAAGAGLTFTEEDIAFLDEVAETILPKTASAGAKEAGVGRYMSVMVNDCYAKDDQEVFHKGIGELDKACDKMHGHGFMKATPEQRTALLVALDKERKDYQKKREDFEKTENEKQKAEEAKGNKKYEKEKMANHYFQQMKQLTIGGYFSSEKGRTTALRYTPVPGKFKGEIDYKPGDKMFVGLT
jgi:hypothetical protein